MNIKNMSAEQLAEIKQMSRDYAALEKDPNAVTKYRFEEIKGYATPEERQAAIEDYVFELFGITEQQAAEIQQLQQQITDLTAANEKMQKQLQAVAKIAQGELELSA